MIKDLMNGVAGGSIVIFVQFLCQKANEFHHKIRVYNWLKNNVTNKDGYRYRSTRAIASNTNLTEDRARYICSMHKSIYLSTGEKEDRWGVYGISGRTK